MSVNTEEAKQTDNKIKGAILVPMEIEDKDGNIINIIDNNRQSPDRKVF